MIKKAMIIIALCVALIGVKVKAITINATNNIESAEDIINIAINNDPNLYSKRYIILKENNNIKMIIFERNEYEIENNQIIINTGKIITRTQNIIEIEEYNDIVIPLLFEIYSNIPGLKNSKANIEYEQYRDRKNIVYIAMIGLGIGLAIMLLKE